MKWFKYVVIVIGFGVFMTSCYKDEFIDPKTEDVGEASNEEEDIIKLTSYKVEGDMIVQQKDYVVSEELKGFQEDKLTHQELWARYTKLIPLSERERMVEFEVFYGFGDIAGYVETISENDLSKWKFALAIDNPYGMSSEDYRKDYNYTIIHEFAHVLSLNESQVNATASNCLTYETEEGCARNKSYLDTFYDLGWADIFEEWKASESEGARRKFYRTYKDRFVTEYAATNPVEDLAESFTHFIIQDERSSNETLVGQKINLFYDYPELTSLREEIRKNSDAVIALKRSMKIR